MINDAKIFEREVLEIEQKSKQKENIDVLFYGSSSIRLWHTLKDDFKDFNVLNHGFGGSKINDTIYYYDRLVKAYHPKVVVCFVGSNDMDRSQKKIFHVLRVFRHFKKLYHLHQKVLNVPMIYILITPTPRRMDMLDHIKQFNEKVKQFANNHKDLHVLDLTDAFIEQGQPIEKLFVSDGLHMSHDGYDIWRKHVLEKLQSLR